MDYKEIAKRYAPILDKMRQQADEASRKAEAAALMGAYISEAARLYTDMGDDARARKMQARARANACMVEDARAAAMAARWAHRPVTPERRARARAMAGACREHAEELARLEAEFYDAAALLLALPSYCDPHERRAAEAEMSRLASIIADAWREHCRNVIML